MNRDPARLAQTAWPLAATAVLARVAFLALLPRRAVSVDLPEWAKITAALAQHRNPYTTGILVWPPLWMQFLAGLDYIARHTGFEFTYVLRSFLIIVDVSNILLALVVMSRYADLRTARRALLIGMALNPIELFLICQHGNFDSLVVLPMLAFALALLCYNRSFDAISWLFASLFLGLGILVKTIPLLLGPLLAYRASALSRRARALGAILFLGPPALGTSIVFVLTPDEILRYVMHYRSYSGWFGVSGILLIGHLQAVSALYSAVFPIAAIAALCWVGRWLWRAADLRDEQLVLLIAVMLAALLAFGPGYGAQYIAWLLPFFTMCYPAFDRQWRRDLMVAFVVAVATYIFEYGLATELGQLFVILTNAPALRHISDLLNDDEFKTLVRLPLFATLVWLVFAGAKRLRTAAPAGPQSGTSRS